MNFISRPAISLQAVWTVLAFVGALCTLLIIGWALLWGNGGVLVWIVLSLPLAGTLGLLFGIFTSFSRKTEYAWATAVSALIVIFLDVLILLSAVHANGPNWSHNAKSILLFLAFAFAANLGQFALSAIKIHQLSK